MKKGQTSVRGGIQDILCPFTDMYITQGSGYSDGGQTHKGTRAIDVRGKEPGIKYPYYAPVTVKAVKVVESSGETLWQSTEKVRFADGDIDYVSLITVHDNTRNSYVGMVVKQGNQLGNMGDKGQATGVHCHIEFAKGKQDYYKNKYGNWGLTNAIEFEDACFMDDTNIIKGVADWKYLKDIPVQEEDYFLPNVNYELLNNINLRLTPFVKENNIPKVKQIDNYTKKLLTSSNPNDNAVMKKGVQICPLEVIKSDNRIWVSYGNCYLCCEDTDGTKLMKKV